MDANIMAAALLGAAGGAVGGLVGGAIDALRARANAGSRKRGAAPILGVLVGMLAANSAVDLRVRLARVIHPPSALEAFAEDLLAIPAVGDRVRGKTANEVGEIMRKLSADGMLKLDDATLIKRAKIVSKMIERADTPRCAAFAKGSLAGEEIMGMTSTLSNEDRAEWFRILRAAVETEVAATPGRIPPTLSDESVSAALSELSGKLPSADQGRFLENLGAMGSIAPDDACWTIRTLYTLVDQASGSTQATAARAIVTP